MFANFLRFLVVISLSVRLSNAKKQSYRGFNDITQMPLARSDMTSTSFRDDLFIDDLGSRIYVIGGCIVDQYCPYNDWCFCPEITAECNYYIPNENTWHSCRSAPQARSRHVAVNLNDKLYLFGGRNVSDFLIHDVDVYDPVFNNWTTLDFKWTDATSDGGAFINDSDDHIYLIGGYDAFYNPLTSLQRFHAGSMEMEIMTPMTVPRGDIGVISVPIQNAISGADAYYHYVIGGFSYDICTPLKDVEVYSITTNSWTTKTSLDIARGDMAVSFIDDILFVIGGETKAPGTCNWTTFEPGQSIPVSDVERFEPNIGVNGTWYYEEDVPSNLFRFIAASSLEDDIIYLFGGQGSNTLFTEESDSDSYYPVLNSTILYVPQSIADRNNADVLNGGEIAGIVIGVIVFCGLFAVGAFAALAWWKYRGYNSAPDDEAAGDNKL